MSDDELEPAAWDYKGVPTICGPGEQPPSIDDEELEPLVRVSDVRRLLDESEPIDSVWVCDRCGTIYERAEHLDADEKTCANCGCRTMNAGNLALVEDLRRRLDALGMDQNRGEQQ